MKFLLFAVGHKQPEWVEMACQEYLKRLPREISVQVFAIKPEPREGKTREQLLAAEGIRIRQNLKSFPRARLVALDEKGEDLTTRQFAGRLQDWLTLGETIAFLIGGADGLEDELKAKARDILRLSSLTLPHGLARTLLCEQLYRASSLLGGHPYHREG
ncbi:MAG: 23S rRNA (pseudouridine(1915)-N(3))-methyltransferase RlmH [Betaproteobacteria bacterium]|nr:23S rRNA (pseudouridine(1915)-N(3))-methyltransferase RlmH [Betaproteobacteria bacterium]